MIAWECDEWAVLGTLQRKFQFLGQLWLRHLGGATIVKGRGFEPHMLRVQKGIICLALAIQITGDNNKAIIVIKYLLLISSSTNPLTQFSFFMQPKFE